MKYSGLHLLYSAIRCKAYTAVALILDPYKGLIGRAPTASACSSFGLVLLFSIKSINIRENRGPCTVTVKSGPVLDGLLTGERKSDKRVP
jgi:hypothetical protein